MANGSTPSPTPVKPSIITDVMAKQSNGITTPIQVTEPITAEPLTKPLSTHYPDDYNGLTNSYSHSDISSPSLESSASGFSNSSSSLPPLKPLKDQIGAKLPSVRDLARKFQSPSPVTSTSSSPVVPVGEHSAKTLSQQTKVENKFIAKTSNGNGEVKNATNYKVNRLLTT